MSNARDMTRVSGPEIVQNKFCTGGRGVMSHARVSGTEIIHNKFCPRGRGVMSHSRAMTRVGGTEIIHNKFGARGQGVVSYPRAMTGSVGRKSSSTNSTVATTVPWLLSFWSRPTTFLLSLKWRVVSQTRSTKVESRKRDEKY
ncbi:hypothetical protein AMTRI_Chr04g185990 [Amborella trichopoda]